MTRVAFSAFLAAGWASLFSIASAQTAPLTGKFWSHQTLRGFGTDLERLNIGTGKSVVPINLSNGAGTFVGTFTLDFPDQTPQGHVSGDGATVFLDSPMITHFSFDMTWTTPTQKSGDPDNIFRAAISAYTLASGLGEDGSHPHCGMTIPLQTGLVANTPYRFGASAECTWTALPLSFGIASISSNAYFVFDGTSVAFPGGISNSLPPLGVFVTSTYSFAGDLSVDHIEMVQTVQDISNSLPLIAEKPTVARVFVKFERTNGPAIPPDGVTALLHGFHGSTELPGSPLSPFNPGGTITAKISFSREVTDDALNFLLPDTWLDAGDLRLVADVNPHRTVPETNYDNNSSAITVNLRPSPILLVNYLPVCYHDLDRCPSNSISKLDAMARKLFPVSDFGFVYAPLKTPRWVWPDTLVDEEDASSLKAFLLRRYALTDSTEGVVPDQLVGWLPNQASLFLDFPLGEADPKWRGSTGRVSFVQDVSDLYPIDAAHFFAHYIAQNLGLRDTEKLNAGSGCGAVDPDTDWPYDDATIHEVGFDTVHKEAVSKSKKDLMSLCDGDKIWISPFDWKKLIAGGLKPQARRTTFSPSAPSDYVIVTGFANRAGARGKIISVDHLATFTGAEASDPKGTHCLRFSDATSTILSSHCFTLTFQAETRGQGNVDLLTEAFSIKAPFPAGATKIALVTGSTQLASVTQSAHAPTISITSPSSGIVWSSINTITWTASDEDGDPLTYAILTSPDNGSTWLPMETDLTAMRFTFDTAELSSGNKTLFKVLASDGFNTAAATVGPVAIAAQPFLEATPALDFGLVAAGQSLTLPVLLTNRGELAVKVTALTLDNARFSTDAALPFSIAPGGSESVNVSFKPTSVGLKTARLTIVSDDTARSPLTVSLSGAGCVSTGGRSCVSPRTPRALPPRS